MKKRKSLFRKLFAFALVLMLAVANVVPAMAQTAEEGSYTITIKNNEGLPGMVDGQFTAYEIFDGIVDDTVGEGQVSNLADITWGNGVNAAALIEALKAATNAPINGAFADISNLVEDEGLSDEEKAANEAASAREVADILIKHSQDSVFLQAFAKIVDANSNDLNGIPSTVTEGETNAQDTSLIDVSTNGAGYYLVVETTAPDDEEVVPSYILDVVGNQEINLKASVPTVSKEIVKGSSTTKADNAGIGDTVKFEITGTLVKNYGDFAKYTYKFTDTMSKGLTLSEPADFEVTIDGHKLKLDETGDKAPCYKVTPNDEDGTTEIEVELGDLKTLSAENFDNWTDVSITKSSKIVLTYSATVNSDAETKNANEVKLTYSNNPNEESSTDNTPNDTVTVYTYELELTKVAEKNTGRKLEGAEFYLSRQGTNDTTEYYSVTDRGEIVWDTDSEKAKVLTTGEDGKFTVKGLDADVEYTLTEETAPAGYNKIDSFSFTIRAESNESEITELSVEGIEGNELVNDMTKTSGNNVAAGKIVIQVEDPKAPFLPFTGAMGTMIFYMLGGLLVLTGTLYLIFEPKKNKVKEQSL